MLFDGLPLATAGAMALRSEMLAWIAIPALLSIGLFGTLVQKQLHGSKRWIKYLAILPLIACLIYGWDKLSQLLGDPAYADYNYIGEGLTLLHWAAVIVPVVVAVGLVVWGLVHDRREVTDI
jgi:hypothetical protein